MRRSPLIALCFALLFSGSAHAARPVVAVLDSGVDASHPALRGAVLRGTDLVDDDRRPTDPRGHGTHVAGIVHRRAPRAKLLPIRISDRRGVAMTADLVAGIRLAAASGAQVINISMAYFPNADAISDAIREAGEQGAVVVAAAGNGGDDLDREPVVPGGLPLANLVTVAAHDRRGRIPSWSGHGRSSVDVAAPGVQIRSTLPGRRRGWISGTSQATAHVSGTLARMAARQPGATPETLRAALREGARPVPTLDAGLARPARALAALTRLLR